MRVLHVSSARTLGGGERHLADLAAGTSARGHEVYAALAPASPLRDALAGVPPQHVTTLPLRNALDVGSALRLARFLRERQIEVVHAHAARDYPVAALAARLAPGARLVLTRHVLFPLGKIHRLTLGNVSRVIAVSEAVGRALRERRVFPARKIRVVTNGIDLERFELAARQLDRAAYRRRLGARAPLLVGTVGELSRVKGQEDFVRAAALVAREHAGGVEFLVVGEDASPDGRNRAALERLVGELDLRESVRLLGRRDDVAEILSCLDVFVSASRSEGFGLALVEAMACGVAVVATATEGAREIIEDGVTGTLVPVGDVGALAGGVSDLLRNPVRRALRGSTARAVARERRGLGRMVGETLRVYEEALEET